jgi:3-hydroxyisobutyrate dehydrogenase
MGPKIGFVGLGRMGANMARRLKETGHTIGAIYDRDAARAVLLAPELDTVAAPTLARVTAHSDLVFTVVSDDAAQLDVFKEHGDSLLVGAAGKIFINCATLTPAIHPEVERCTHQAGARSLEACMASSIPQARQGTLYLMCGGDSAVFEQCRPVLEKLSSTLRYIGRAGQAAQVKALVNMIMNANTAALAEGLGLGQALGLDLTMLREVFAATGAASQVLKTDGEDMQLRAHDCFFSAAHAAKDSGIAWRMGRDVGFDLPVARATKEQYDRMVALGLGDLDKSGVAELTFPDRRAELRR